MHLLTEEGGDHLCHLCLSRRKREVVTSASLDEGGEVTAVASLEEGKRWSHLPLSKMMESIQGWGHPCLSGRRREVATAASLEEKSSPSVITLSHEEDEENEESEENAENGGMKRVKEGGDHLALRIYI